jgi:tetratricopeptide (TPR) repeat protein/class 3 adenylate cyclase
VDQASITRVFLFTDLVGSTVLKRSGDAQAAEVVARHDELFRACLARHDGIEIDNAGDGFFATFERPSDALRCAIDFQKGMSNLKLNGQTSARVGLHMGEVAQLQVRTDAGGKQKLVGQAVDTAARVMSLACGGQVLMTRHIFDSARQHVSASEDGSPVTYLAHGPYLLKGVDDPLEVFEAGIAGLSPLKPPQDSDKARRAVAPGDEDTLGWRPAVGLKIPNCEQWTIERRLGEGGFGEVWLAQHGKTHEKRTFKFCFESDRVRTLKRELTLFRVMKEALGERPDIARLYDVQLDVAPYFLEMEYTAGGSLIEWADHQGGIHMVPFKKRVEIVAQVASALAAAHSVGVIHKDVKPQNVLIHENKDGSVQARLTDFGIGMLVSTEMLKGAGITSTSFDGKSMATTKLATSSGTRLYMAPELMVGMPSTIQSDIYALGVMLYQSLAGDFMRPLAQGWERGLDEMLVDSSVSDRDGSGPMGQRPGEPSRQPPPHLDREYLDLLIEDVAACVVGVRKERLASAETLAQRLRSLNRRCIERQDERKRVVTERQRARALERQHRRVRLIGICAAALAIFAGVAGVGYFRTERERNRAEKERDKAQKTSSFMQQMLSGVGPSVAVGRDTTMLREMMDAAAKRITDGELSDVPEVELQLRLTIGDTYRDIAAYDAAEQMLSPAVELARRSQDGSEARLASALDSHAQLLHVKSNPSDALKEFQSALSARQRLYGGDHESVAESLNHMAGCLESLGHQSDALEKYEAALVMRQRLFKGDHKAVAESLNNVALCLWSLGRRAEALARTEEVLAIRRRLFKGDHPDIAASLASVASCLEAMGKMEEALPRHQEALAMWRRLYKGDHPALADCLDTVALCLLSLGRANEALPAFEEALAIQQRLFKGDHTSIASSLTCLASCLQSMSRPEDALAKHQDALAMWRRLFKGDHPDVALGLNSVASCLLSLGRSREALPQFQEALAINQRLFKGDHPEIAATMQGEARCLKALGQVPEAISRLEAALNVYQNVYKGDHPAIAKVLINLADCRTSLGQPEVALPKLEAALAMARRLHKGDHPSIASNLNGLGACLKSMGRLEEALPQYEAALSMSRRIYKGDHRDVVRGLNNVATCLAALGRMEEAMPQLEASVAISRRIYKGDHPEIASGLNNLAACLEVSGRSAVALRKIEEVLAMHRRLYHGDHPDVARDLSNLGACLYSLGRFAEALPQSEASLAMSKRLYKGDHPALATGLNNLAMCLDALGRSEDALPMVEAALTMRRRLLPETHADVQTTRINLGRVLIGMHRFSEAEELLLKTQELVEHRPMISVKWKRLNLEGLVKLYESWHTSEPREGYDKMAAQWRIKLKAWQATTQPSTRATSTSQSASTR